jgi:hypothetical protein
MCKGRLKGRFLSLRILAFPDLTRAWHDVSKEAKDLRKRKKTTEVTISYIERGTYSYYKKHMVVNTFLSKWYS